MNIESERLTLTPTERRNKMTMTYANIHKERTNQLKEYLESRKSIWFDKDFKVFRKEWVKSQICEIGLELSLRGEMTSKEFITLTNELKEVV